MQAAAAVLGGTQSLHTNGFDEALGLPTENAARLALRTQQVLGHETGIADTIDPLAGSYFVEYLTDEIERRAGEYIERIDQMGGSVKAIEAGFIQNEIARAAYEAQKRIETGEDVVVGVNRFQIEEKPFTDVLKVDDSLRTKQIERLERTRATRDAAAVDAALAAIRSAAVGSDNLMPHILAAVEAYATLGEISDTLRATWGEFEE
jgi:methylmalonyl-CoA mutase, N-terminal domain